MKLSVVAAIAASAVYASAAPLRVLVVSTSSIQRTDGAEGPFTHLRFGHAIPTEDQVGRMLLPLPDQSGGHPHPHPHHNQSSRPCAGRMFKMKEKTIEIANKFREAFGLPLIETGHHGHGPPSEFRIIPVMGSPTLITGVTHNGGPTWEGMTKGGDRVRILPAPAFGPAYTTGEMHRGGEGRPRPHPHGNHHHRRPDSFMFRMQSALLSLGPWEGRAVAFVMGCGIGVLLRMLWVLAIVTYRSLRSGDDEYEYARVLVVEEDEQDQGVRSAPPVYVYPVDEKIAVETETVTRVEDGAKVDDAPK